MVEICMDTELSIENEDFCLVIREHDRCQVDASYVNPKRKLQSICGFNVLVQVWGEN